MQGSFTWVIRTATMFFRTRCAPFENILHWKMQNFQCFKNMVFSISIVIKLNKNKFFLFFLLIWETLKIDQFSMLWYLSIIFIIFQWSLIKNIWKNYKKVHWKAFKMFNVYIYLNIQTYLNIGFRIAFKKNYQSHFTKQ